MNLTYKADLDQEFQKALSTMRRDPFARLPQKQAEAVVAALASRETPDESGWTFSNRIDSFTRMLPFIIGAFNAIDRDCDEVISAEEFHSWMRNPGVEHRDEDAHWKLTSLANVEASLPALCPKGLDGPQGLVVLMEHIKHHHFKAGRSTMTLSDCVLASMTVFACTTTASSSS
eukprot:TRINITY_DN90828_c0_g1_i1.p1 TRINITY_DN90828_c0_g1~~TRINITY_DN90828_c0_g1_i1.p1  ORF type:complete len:174 (-),score=37.86 TRINITY_DN90828_c0_g1_i1:18-539(-)